MSYCEDCILLDLCGIEDCCDDAMTFCADKHKFISKSVIEDIKTGIEPKCDRINSLASVLPYTAHREIQELLCEIMDLFEPQESEDKE